MRKTLFFQIPLLLSASVLTAQDSEQATMKKDHSAPIQKSQAMSVRAKIDPVLADAIKKEGRQLDSEEIDSLKASTGRVSRTDKRDDNEFNGNSATVNKVVVDIVCAVTPALVQLINKTGGVLIKRDQENGLITADVPVSKLIQIAFSTDVKRISVSSTNTKVKSVSKS